MADEINLENLECYRKSTMDARLIILGEAPADESGECRR